MLKALRKNKIINRVVRSLMKRSASTAHNFYESISARWTVSGVIELDFNGTSFKLFTDCDDGLADCFYYRKKYEEENDLKVFLELVKQSRIVVDIGANTGVYAILSAKTNPQAEIFAFEPYRYNYRRLRKNCEINELENVRVFEKAVGDAKSKLKFAVPKTERIIDVSSADEEFSKKFYDGAIEWTTTEVEQTTLDDFAAEELHGKKIDLIKMDVESYEMAVFRGMKNVLQNDQPNILFETFIDDQRKEFFDRIADEYDYNAYIFLREGVLRLNDGFERNHEGLNFFLSKHKTAKTYTSFREMDKFLSGLEADRRKIKDF